MPARRVVRPPRVPYGSRPGQPPPGRRRLPIRPVLKILVLGAAIVWLFGQFRIRAVEIAGAQSLTVQGVEEKARSALRHQILGQNLLTLRSGKLGSDLMTQEPLIKTVRVQRRWPNRLKLTVEERRPSLIWQTGGQDYLIDADGSVIRQAGDPALPVVVDSANLPVKAGDRVAPERFVRFVTDLTARFGESGLSVTQFRVPESTSELYALTNKNYVVKFDTTRPVEEQVTDLISVLAALNRAGKSPAEYIDLRIAGKAYYR